MIERIHATVAALSAGLLVILLVLLIIRRRCSRKRTEPISRTGSLQDGIAILHQQQRKVVSDSRRRGNYYKFRRERIGLEKPKFSWSDHPSLVTDAVENGWSRFAFANMISSSSTKSSILGLCNVGDYAKETDVELSWEVCTGSADLLQKIRLNCDLNKNNLSGALAVITTAFPLPGPGPPLLEPCSFPQEAYFEITVLATSEDELIGRVNGEGEKMKLIEENSISELDEFKINVKEESGKGEAVTLCLGLTGGGSVPMKLPGTYSGSVGFNSNGSVYLDGIKLVYKTEKGEWGRTNKVIGCGFDPRQKNVFFTVDSELAHVIRCKSDEFGTPMYPTLAANGDITVLVNFGQSVFEYAPANANRTPNPCFIGSNGESPAASLSYEDSKELFSMGRIDSQWLNRCTTNNSSCNNGSNHNRTMDFDQESDTDLFEIVLNSSGRSPK